MRNHESNRRSSYNDQWDDLMPDSSRPKIERIARERFQANLAQDEPDGLWQKIVKKATEPNTLGAIAAIGFATVITADVVLNGPSEFVVNSPEAATTALALGAAAVGTLANRGARLAKMKDLKAKRQAEHDARRKEQQW